MSVFKDTIPGIIVLGVISSVIASYIWEHHSSANTPPAYASSNTSDSSQAGASLQPANSPGSSPLLAPDNTGSGNAGTNTPTPAPTFKVPTAAPNPTPTSTSNANPTPYTYPNPVPTPSDNGSEAPSPVAPILTAALDPWAFSRAVPGTPVAPTSRLAPGLTYTAHHKGGNGCDGQLTLSLQGLVFDCGGDSSRSFGIPLAAIQGTDDDGVILSNGDKFHFSVAGEKKQVARDLFTGWLYQARNATNITTAGTQ